MNLKRMETLSIKSIQVIILPLFLLFLTFKCTSSCDDDEEVNNLIDPEKEKYITCPECYTYSKKHKTCLQIFRCATPPTTQMPTTRRFIPQTTPECPPHYEYNIPFAMCVRKRH